MTYMCWWRLVYRKADFVTKRIDSNRTTNRINSNCELECSTRGVLGGAPAEIEFGAF